MLFFYFYTLAIGGNDIVSASEVLHAYRDYFMESALVRLIFYS